MGEVKERESTHRGKNPKRLRDEMSFDIELVGLNQGI